ncbi:MAG: UTP--glucose-1-phosphate uridylyltransferase GalU [Bacilli bacterium]
MKKVTKAVIPAAGLGTRFLPATKALPKEMLPIIDTPNLQYIVEEAVKAGITDILLIISGSKKAIEDYFDVNAELEMRLKASKKDEEAKMIRDIANMANITFVHQKEPKGLGDAVLCAKSFAGDDPIAVLLGDDLITSDDKSAIGELIEAYYATNGGTQLGCKEVPTELLKKYGVVKPLAKAEGKNFQICDMVEKPATAELAPSNIAVLGRYVLPPEIFTVLENTKPGVGGEIQLTDAIKESMKLNPCYACIFSGTRYDIGNKFGYIKAIIDYSLKRDDLKDDVMNYLEEIVKNK